MPEITILKDINRTRGAIKNEFHTYKINVAEYTGNDLVGIPSTIYAWIKDNTYKELITSEWEEIFSVNNSTLDIVNKLMSSLGAGSLKTKKMYRQIWKSSKPMVITLNMFFQAEIDPIEDVEKPIRLLQKTCVPTEILSGDSENNAVKQIMSNFLNAPGVNHLKGPLSEGKQSFAIESIKIGNWLTLRNIVVQEIDTDWDILNMQSVRNKKGEIKGVPLSADVSLKILFQDVWTNLTIDELLNNRQDVDKAIPIDIFEAFADFGSSFVKSLENKNKKK